MHEVVSIPVTCDGAGMIRHIRMVLHVNNMRLTGINDVHPA